MRIVSDSASIKSKLWFPVLIFLDLFCYCFVLLVFWMPLVSYDLILTIKIFNKYLKRLDSGTLLNFTSNTIPIVFQMS